VPSLNVDRSAIPLSLYVHIPWCERKCPYCDFNSHEHFDSNLEQPYIDALLSDLASQVETVSHRELVAIFIGGGTPSLFSDGGIAHLLSGINRLISFAANCEVTLETNPGSAEAAKFEGLSAAGINRLSIGVQSFSDNQLSLLGRIHTADDARRACDLAARHFQRFNIDLMHGLPGQNVASALTDLHEGIERAGGHLSWYQLTIEPNTVFYNKPPTIPVEDVLADIQDEGETLLVDTGFLQYEVSAWAQPDQASKHNLNYWEFGDYLGIGAGAHGKLTRADGTIVRTRRTRLPVDYLASIQGGKSTIDAPISNENLPSEFMLNALRLKNGVTSDLFEQRTGLPLTQIEATLATLSARGLLMPLCSGRLQTSALGFRFLNEVLAAFLPNNKS